jgi:Glycosyl transferase family 2
MKISPIVLFVYNRPWHTRQTVEYLQKNELANQSELFVFSDGPKDGQSVDNVEKVREYVRSIHGFKQVSVIEREKNYGLAANIIDGVSKIVNEYGRIIVLEDDLVTSPYFLSFMNDGLETYKNEDQVASIHGYIYPLKNSNPLPETFFIKGADCWGWATWKRAWDLFEADGKKLLHELNVHNLANCFDFDGAYPYTKMLENQINGKNNSWAIRWYASAFLKNKLTLYPGRSLVHNIGIDGSGTHCSTTEDFTALISHSSIKVEQIPVEENEFARTEIANFHRFRQPLLYSRVLHRISNLFNRVE